MSTRAKILLMDANILIDYQKSDFSILGTVARHLGEVYVLSTILDEVDELTPALCERQGFKVIEPQLDHLLEAASKRGRLSFRDHLCLLVARDQGLTCVTNDKPLRRACQDESVSVLWGLELMTELVDLGRLQARTAIDTAQQIHRSNPLHIPQSLVDRFTQKVLKIDSKKKRPS